MWACWVPQYSAHWPRYVPGSHGVSHITLRRFGMTSVLPASRGIQKLCATSADSNVRYVATRAGTCSSFGHDPEVRILELPPPLVADHAHVNRVGGRRRRLDLVGRPHGRRDQDEHDENR